MIEQAARGTITGGRRAAGPVPDRASLRAMALAHLARFGTTRAGLTQVLERAVQRWARRAVEGGALSEDVEARAAPLGAVIERVVADMVALGAVDDAAFAGSRARSLTRSGRSRRAVQAHLAARGVEAEMVGTVLDETLGARGQDGQEMELAAALIFARRRRAGPFAPVTAGDDAMPGGDGAVRRRKALDAMARAGFGRATAEAALDMDPEEAEDRIIRMKSA
ncbi:regulatory protein RecX [Gluconacetobacter takamatsuzukensis]|uniref:Regulatory protein RecX n=1 Tax=Gluconacetobacter takamatsuzukensis TaxID=1286190 RepID=A0A7W4KAW1_9PROT|nr:RecX family transcriptional regulator [Gluconacetobacter takamatsuzukensis]MBB2203507.1 regulatory protein RecX [Gluconacetobacter takamatsuzukensis]